MFNSAILLTLFLFCSYSRSMHALTESVWEVISWKSKSRYDTASDQYTRIFMPKLFIISSLIMAFSYFNDKLNCMVTERLEPSKDFVQETCWIQGFYIFNEMENHLENSAFYGIPDDTTYDGTDINGEYSFILFIFLIYLIYSWIFTQVSLFLILIKYYQWSFYLLCESSSNEPMVSNFHYLSIELGTVRS